MAETCDVIEDWRVGGLSACQRAEPCFHGDEAVIVPVSSEAASVSFPKMVDEQSQGPPDEPLPGAMISQPPVCRAAAGSGALT